jgi:hypothetical protein
MITNEEAQRNYSTAREALNQIIRSDSATEQERQQAARQRDELILNYDVHARSVAYATFIEAMAALIADLGPNRSLEGLQTLQGIVSEAAALIRTVQQEEERRKTDPGK